MGRGRAKAKQTKVARELKYNAPQTDLEALQAELSGQKASRHDDDGPDDGWNGPMPDFLSVGIGS